MDILFAYSLSANPRLQDYYFYAACVFIVVPFCVNMGLIFKLILTESPRNKDFPVWLGENQVSKINCKRAVLIDRCCRAWWQL